MSKITLEPNSSGAGTFSIVSPDSNTNRTLNLPDEAGKLLSTGNDDPAEVFKQSNILGTVSESSGVPTGAIIERGSNSNGEYVKYADGTMIAGRTLGQSAQSSGTWTFPVAFSAAPHISNSGCRTIESGVGEGIGVITPSGNFPVSTTGYNWRFSRLSGIGDRARFFAQTAFGRWF